MDMMTDGEGGDEGRVGSLSESSSTIGGSDCYYEDVLSGVWSCTSEPVLNISMALPRGENGPVVSPLYCLKYSGTRTIVCYSNLVEEHESMR
jgi:hypothetical protein